LLLLVLIFVLLLLAGVEEEAGGGLKFEEDLVALWGRCRSTASYGPLVFLIFDETAAAAGYEETRSSSFPLRPFVGFEADPEPGLLPPINSFLPSKPPEEDHLPSDEYLSWLCLSFRSPSKWVLRSFS
jgi:hypothetical protein